MILAYHVRLEIRHQQFSILDQIIGRGRSVL